ncbi:MAG: glycosyltransferase [Planctomycetota bacterium]
MTSASDWGKMVSQSKLKTLHINTARTWRGGEQQMLYLLRGLQNRGYPAAAVIQKGAPAVDRARAAGVRVWELPMRCEMDFPAAFQIALLARHSDCNILHAHTAHAHSLASIAKNIFKAGTRLVAHRRIEFYPGRGILGLGWLKYHYGVDAYITVSERLRQILLDAGLPPDQIFTVRSVTDTQRFKNTPPNPELRNELGIPEDAFVVGNVGYLVPHKDHANLLDAAAIVSAQIPDAWFVIVGSGPLRSDIRAKAREIGLSDRIILTGFRDDIPELIKMFDLFALSSSEEGICSTLFEVMACETPIVCTNAAGVAEAVLDHKTGLVVPRKAPRALAEGILQLIRHPEQARKYARAAHERVLNDFTVAQLTERTVEVYKSLVE